LYIFRCFPKLEKLEGDDYIDWLVDSLGAINKDKEVFKIGYDEWNEWNKKTKKWVNFGTIIRKIGNSFHKQS
jgi:hypothetical protein